MVKSIGYHQGGITHEGDGGATLRDDGAGGDAMDAPNIRVRGVLLASSLSVLWWRCIMFVTFPVPLPPPPPPTSFPFSFRFWNCCAFFYEQVYLLLEVL